MRTLKSRETQIINQLTAISGFPFSAHSMDRPEDRSLPLVGGCTDRVGIVFSHDLEGEAGAHTETLGGLGFGAEFTTIGGTDANRIRHIIVKPGTEGECLVINAW